MQTQLNVTIKASKPFLSGLSRQKDRPYSASMTPGFSALRDEVWRVNLALPRAGLVTMHSGNASGIHRESGLVLIKPSGVDYETLRPEDLCVVDLNGVAVPKTQVPEGIASPL